MTNLRASAEPIITDTEGQGVDIGRTGSATLPTETMMGKLEMPHACTLKELRELVSIQAMDETLWDPSVVHIETAYFQQALRYLTHAIEGTWSYRACKDAIQEMMP